MSLKDAILGPFLPCRSCKELKLKVTGLEKAAEAASRENKALKEELAALKAAVDASTESQPVLPISPMPSEAGWAHLKASVIGFKKPVLQDAHQVVIEGDDAVLIVCDGAGSKKRSGEGANFIVGFLADKFRQLRTEGVTISTDDWPKLVRGLLRDAALGLREKAKAENASFDDYGCTCIVVYAGPDFVACAHVGDGRAGYLAPSGHWKALMTPYKGALANATVFVTMLDESNAASLVECQVVKARTRAIVALSDGPEDVCWQVSAFDPAGQKVVDPNQPSNEFLGKIANQLAAATAQKAPQDKLDKLWAEFLTNGSPKLAAQVDDKTLLLALRG